MARIQQRLLSLFRRILNILFKQLVFLFLVIFINRISIYDASKHFRLHCTLIVWSFLFHSFFSLTLTGFVCFDLAMLDRDIV